jgi:hypothetical protein
MAGLSFMGKLTPEQKEYADLIAKKAQEMGIPPELAVGIAFRESGLNPGVGRGSSGEYGIMQVMPKTGETLGFSEKDLQDPSKNIEAGLKYLKMSLDRVKSDPASKEMKSTTINKLAAAGYNAGIDSEFFKTGELNPITKKYLKDLDSFGAFKTTVEVDPDEATQTGLGKPPQEESDEPAPLEDVPPPPPEEAKIGPQDPREKLIYQGTGAAVGAAPMLKRGAGNLVEDMAVRREMGKARAQTMLQRQQAPGGLPGAPAAPSGPPQSVVRLPTQGQPQGGPLAGLGGRPTPMGGSGVFNYGKEFGLTDIEAGRALDMTKQAGGVHDLTTQRREAMQKLGQMFPGDRFAENPRYGGLMTQAPSVGGGPRASFTTDPATGELRPLPPRQPVPTTPKPPTPLERVSMLYEGMMTSRPAQTLGRVGRTVFPPLALAGAAGEAADIKQQMDLPEDQRDLTRMGLSGLSVLGTGLSFFPPTAPIGIGLSLGAPTLQMLRDMKMERDAKAREAQAPAP